jgi:hypothetical protein
MPTPKTKASKLAESLGDFTVEELDAALLEIKRTWNRTYALRQLRAAEEGITTDPPSPPGASPVPDIRMKGARVSPPTSPVNELMLIAGSATDVVYRILERYPQGIAYPMLRDEFEKTEYAKTAAPGTKPYHYGAQRLRTIGHAVAYKGRLFLHQHLEKFKEEVAAGRVPDLVEEKKLNSKWALAILEYLRSREKDLVQFKEICDHIRSLPAFKDNKNVAEQASVALNGLNIRHHLIEKIKIKGKTHLYRIKSNEAGPVKEADETFWGAEADTSTPPN